MLPITPVNENYLILPEAKREKTDGGIYIPYGFTEAVNLVRGEIKADPVRGALLKAGDVVMFPFNAGYLQEIDGVNYKFVAYKNLWALVAGDAIIPLNDKLIVLSDPAKEVSEGGLHIPDMVNHKSTATVWGTAISVSKEVPEIKEGDRVMYPHNAGIEQEIAGVKHFFLLLRDVWGIDRDDAVTTSK